MAVVLNPFVHDFGGTFVEHPHLLSILERELPDHHLIRLALMSGEEMRRIPGVGDKRVAKIVEVLNAEPRDDKTLTVTRLEMLFRNDVLCMPAGLLLYLDFNDLTAVREDTKAARFMIEALQSIFDDYELCVGDLILFNQEEITTAVAYKLFEDFDIDFEVASTMASEGLAQLKQVYFEYAMVAETVSLAIWERDLVETN